MSKKQIIFLDIDETINNLKEVWVDLYNKKYNDNLIVENITDFNISKFVKPEAKEDIFVMLDTPGLFNKMLVPPKGAIEVTELLSQYYDIYPLSACTYPRNYVEKIEYVEKYFPHIQIKNFIACLNKSLVKGDYMIDDYHENLRYFDGNRILMNKSHNLFVDNLPENVNRVNNWEDILMYFALQNDDILKWVTFEYSKKGIDI